MEEKFIVKRKDSIWKILIVLDLGRVQEFINQALLKYQKKVAGTNTRKLCSGSLSEVKDDCIENFAADIFYGSVSRPASETLA